MRSCLPIFCQEMVAELRPEEAQLSFVLRGTMEQVYTLHTCVQCRHRARAGPEEHLSQDTAQRWKLRSETPQKLGQQVIPSSGSFGEGMKGFLNHRALWVKCVHFYRMQVFLAARPEFRTNAVCEKQRISKHGKTGPLYSAFIQACLAEMPPSWDWSLLVSSNTSVDTKLVLIP